MGLFSDIINSITNSVNTNKTNQANQAIQDSVNQTNLDINNATNAMNYRIMQETNRANRALSEYEWSKNLQMWNLQNEYNTPSAQMARYKAAGLNPNLIYGNVSSGNASVLPKYQAAQQQSATMQPGHVDAYRNVAPKIAMTSGIMDVLNQFQDYRNKKANEDLLRANEQSTRLGMVLGLNKDSRAQGLYNYDLQYRGHLVNKIANDVLMQQSEAEYKRFQADIAAWDYNFRRKYHTTPNNPIGAIASMANEGLITPLLDWLFPKRSWLKSGIVLNQNY